MNARIQAAASLVGPCEIFADIGCDHGYLSRTALLLGRCKTAYACDVAPKPLQKARELLQGFSNAEFYLSDGFKGLPKMPSEAAVCGMGGREIIRIIDGAVSQGFYPALVLQPQNYAAGLRAFLCKSGYRITGDLVIFERGRYYDIIRAERGEGSLEPVELAWGAFCKTKSPLLLQRLLYEKAKIQGYSQTEQNHAKLKLIEEALKWQL
ncbi:MAG: class I SAM-dependent methyltransferase [Clostridiales bacterium]|nr:class I SAM-dependent methyltransferase [Clostridiales bacterium]